MTTRGRKPLPSVIEQTEPLAAEAVAAIEHDMHESAALPVALAEVQENAVALARKLGYEGPLAPDLLEEGARESLTRINFEIFSVGARLMLLKEQCAHGEFIERLERLGVERTMAARLMQATRKFPNVATSQHLASLGKSKIFELAMLDDGEAEAFANGGTVRGITLDDVECMSVSELRRALRKEKADKEAELAKAKAGVSGELAAKDKVIAEKSQLISKLVAEKNKAECQTDEERYADLDRQLMEDMLRTVGSLKPIRKTVHNIRTLEKCPQGLYVAMQGALDRIIAEAMSIATDYGIQLNLAASGEFEDDPNAGEVFGLPPADFGPAA